MRISVSKKDMTSGFRALGSILMDLLFPPKCPFCCRVLDDGEDGLCGRCLRELPWTEGQCIQKVEGFLRCASPLWYDGYVREAVHRYKFRGRPAYGKVLGRLAARCAAEHMEGPWDIVTWVPVSKKRLRERGYDQARLMALSAAEMLEVPALPLLRKVLHTEAQSLLKDPDLRRANVLGAYEAIPSNGIEGKRVLLVDDVITTGSTISECAVTLFAAGAREIGAVTLARGKKQGHRETTSCKKESTAI